MARHLARPEFDLAVWNRTGPKAEAMARELGVRHARTPADAARDCDIVITCLPVSRYVEALLDGPDGLLATMQSGAVLVDCTSGDGATSRRMAARLAERGIGFLDAPVSGGVVGAEQGALTVMVGGDAATLERVQPVLACFGKRIVHCGAVGAGVGEVVLYASGSSARQTEVTRDRPCDAVIMAIVDTFEVGGKEIYHK